MTSKKTVRGKCPRCCPDGGAVFEVMSEYDFDTKTERHYRKCNNCFLKLEIKKRPPSGKPNARQARLLAKILERFGGEQESHMVGRKVWVSGKNYARGCLNGESYFGTIGSNGKLDLTFQAFGRDVKITDMIGVDVYLDSSFLKAKAGVQ
jgi:hypothetical protein